MVSSDSRAKVVFGDCTFDHAARQLTRSGRGVPLSPKAFELLAALLEARPRAVSKQDLHDRLWPDTHVTHTSLPRVVVELRKAIGDRRLEARFLRTVHGFGYAFSGGTAPRRPGTETARFGIVWRAREIGLEEAENLIGRGTDCQVRIDLPDISRHHARIRIAGEAATIEDLGSKNGTCVSGKPVLGPTNLWDGAEIIVGSEPLVFRVSGASRSTKTRRRRV